MSKELVCPFCNKKLEPIGTSGQFQCGTWGCDASFNFIATRDVWEYIDRTRKALEQSKICCTEWEKQALDYKAENIALSGDLECTRKALDVAKDTIRHADWFFDGDYNVDAKTMHNEIKYAIKAVTALEQKE